MAKCNDCWCEHYDKSRGNCDKCLKNEEIKDSPYLKEILQRRAVKQMEVGTKDKEYGQTR